LRTGYPELDKALQSVAYISARVPGVVELRDRKISASVEMEMPVPFASEPENSAVFRKPLLHFSRTGYSLFPAAFAPSALTAYFWISPRR
jgi:hypothetical protein